MNMLLISKTDIIKQIIKLVASKLNLELTILDVNIVSSKFDIIIIEDSLFDDNFPTKNFANKLGIITKNTNLFKNISDFILPKPFLPSLLFETLNEQIKLIKMKPKNLTKNNKNIANTLTKDIANEVTEKTDESIITGAFMPKGGILDPNELSKIQNMLETNKNKKTISQDDEWVDLANVIDKAINEVKDYQFKTKEPIELILNNYSINEISGLLNKLDQDIVDALINGKEITLKLKVKK
jgi:hypothetical protein